MFKVFVWLFLTVSMKSFKINERNNKEKHAVDEWNSIINSTVMSVNGSLLDWRYALTMEQSDTLHFYMKKFDTLFLKHGFNLNFISIGACDGTYDSVIDDFFISTWQGLFVEPMSLNVHDLQATLKRNNVAHRSHMIRAAVNETCYSDRINITRPLYEEKRVRVPHWKRRQIGKIADGQVDKNFGSDWVFEEVYCLTFEGIMRRWKAFLIKDRAQLDYGNGVWSSDRTLRPHVVKIDTEGNDFFVVRSILNYGMISPENLPLLLLFEVKTFSQDKFDTLKGMLEKAGYITSSYNASCRARDAFALLAS